MKQFIVLIMIALLFMLPSPEADVPTTIGYQGLLREQGGPIVVDGWYQLAFKLYTLPAGGTPEWEEIQNVFVEQGFFNVYLGEIVSLDLPFDETYYLGVSVDGEPELMPRVAFASVPYAMRPRYAFTDRGDPSGHDKTVEDFICNNQWYDWDLSSIVPKGAKAILLSCRVLTPIDGGRPIEFRKKGNTNDYAITQVITQAANVLMTGTVTVPCNADRIIQYRTNSVTYSIIDVVILGWWN